MQSDDVSSILKEFRNHQRAIELFSRNLAGLVGALLERESIKVHAVEFRAKTEQSLTDKLSRPEKNYQSLWDVIDLCGIRIIVYYQSDVVKVSEVINREFEVDPEDSGDAGLKLAEDQFGYLSVHQVLKLSPARSSLVEWSAFKTYKAEIQVRTVLQHAWAAISHELKYKREADVPRALGRKLSRLAGLLELADEQFEELKQQSQTLAKSSARGVKRGNLRIPIDQDSLTQFLASNPPVVSAVLGAALSIPGYKLIQLDHDGFDDDDYSEAESISGLSSLSKLLGIETLEQLKDELETLLPYAITFFKKAKSPDHIWQISTAFAVTLLLILRHPVPVVAAFLEKRLDWSEVTAKRAVDAAANTLSEVQRPT